MMVREIGTNADGTVETRRDDPGGDDPGGDDPGPPPSRLDAAPGSRGSALFAAMAKAFLVTGATGYVGAALIESSTGLGKVTGLSRRPPAEFGHRLHEP